MSRILCVVDDPAEWPLALPNVSVVSAQDYLTDPRYSALPYCRVYNLCRSYRYQTAGYYVSLLAEARGHKPMPNVSTMQDLRFPSVARAMSGELDDVLDRTLGHLRGAQFQLPVYFGHSINPRYDRLARSLFNLFPVPLLRAHFVREDDGWELRSAVAISMDEVPAGHREVILKLASAHFAHPAARKSRRAPARYRMAILRDRRDPTPPSDDRALEQFCEAAERLRMEAELISEEDYGELAEYDALFIRETTAVNNPTYRFARRAEAEGLVVIDDPDSIVRCTNKVFLAELLQRHRIPVPRTCILHRHNIEEVRRLLGLPLVLKQPDSAFSLGVVRVQTEEEYHREVERLLQTSDLLIAQEFIQTSFDWRIGIIDRRPLFACQYYMARNHWQVYHHLGNGEPAYGPYKTLPVELAPRRVVHTALRAANLIGDGFYGVDLKVVNGRVYVIEVNDNPSVESDVEDRVLRQTLYDRVMEVFLARLEARRQGHQPGS
jgi:glutathione synthase/RimK-type ligase-like ATP-grasp enzyme